MRHFISLIAVVIAVLSCRAVVPNDSLYIAQSPFPAVTHTMRNGEKVQLFFYRTWLQKFSGMTGTGMNCNNIYHGLMKRIPYSVPVRLLIGKDGRIIDYKIESPDLSYPGKAPVLQLVADALEQWYPGVLPPPCLFVPYPGIIHKVDIYPFLEGNLGRRLQQREDPSGGN